MARVASAHVEGIGTTGPADHEEALGEIIAQVGGTSGAVISAAAHRVVHGGPDFAEPVVVDDHVLSRLDALAPLAPLHQPHNVAGIRAAMRLFPGAMQIACFDTAFHRAERDDAYAIPRRFYEEGVRRYGFHGLSYEFVSHRLAELDPDFAKGRVVIAHLGNGASACIVKDGRSMGSTMGFSPLDGLIMGTRPGQIDPGVLLWMVEAKGMSGAEISTVLYRESGLRALTGESDMRALEASGDPEARRGIERFVERLCREVASLAALTDGMDGLVFTGGIGENSVLVRRLAMARLGWLGIVGEEEANRRGDAVI